MFSAHVRRAFALFPVFALAACSGGGGDATLVPGSAPPVFVEAEPNDFSAESNFVGFVLPGTHVFLEGYMDGFPFDPRDGWSFVADQPCEVQVILRHDLTGDLDMRIWDPFVGPFGDYVLDFGSPFNPENGVFQVFDFNTEFHIVVLPFSGFGHYEVEVIVRPLPAFFATASVEGDGSIHGEGVSEPRVHAGVDPGEGYATPPLGELPPLEEEPEGSVERAVLVDPVSGEVVELETRAPRR